MDFCQKEKNIKKRVEKIIISNTNIIKCVTMFDVMFRGCRPPNLSSTITITTTMVMMIMVVIDSSLTYI